MKISTKIRYGARAMLQLAFHYGQGPMDLKMIAKKEAISVKYLEQVIIPLRSAGVVKAVRGAKGGYTLAKSPSEICLNDIIEILEGPINLVDCLKDPKSCQMSPSCVTKDIWQEVSETLHGIFHSITLEEMVNRKKKKEGIVVPTYQI